MLAITKLKQNLTNVKQRKARWGEGASSPLAEKRVTSVTKVTPLDFDAIWRRYYETANRRFESGLTYNELWFVVTGEKKEEE